MFLDYGYRSRCCYAPIKLGQKKVKGTTLKINIWVCCKCGKRDVPIIEHTKDGRSGSSQEIEKAPKFIPDDVT